MGSPIAQLKHYLLRILTVLTTALVAIALVITMLWRDRPDLADIDIPLAPPAPVENTGVRVTWFGVTTLLFDDGETQILIDGFISRPALYEFLTNKPVENDVATINRFLAEYRVRRLAAIIPVHSHYDHAMDIGAIANRSSASILGSETSAQIGRGAGVPEDQIVVVKDGAEYEFGAFRVRFIESNHAPIGWRGTVPWPGALDEPLQTPAPVNAWPEGGSFSVVVSHPSGSTLIQGSAGIREANLDDLQIDVVFLGVGLLESLGRDYSQRYWQHTVTSTGASVVIPVHFDDYTRPFGTTELMPSILDDFRKTSELLKEFRRTWDPDSEIWLPVFGEAMQLYTRQPSEISG